MHCAVYWCVPIDYRRLIEVAFFTTPFFRIELLKPHTSTFTTLKTPFGELQRGSLSKVSQELLPPVRKSLSRTNPNPLFPPPIAILSDPHHMKNSFF